MKYEVKDSSDIQPDTLTRTKSPYQQMIDDVRETGEFYTYPEVGEMLGLSRPTISAACKGTGIPSKYVQWGKRHVWLFTRDDVVEVAAIMKISDIKWP